MPELPEVETMRRGVASVVGSRIVCIERPPCRKRPIAISPRIDVLNRRAWGERIGSVERIGKRVVFRFESGDSLVIEPRMTGLVLLSQPPTQEHVRLRVKLTGGTNRELLFWDRRGLGTVRLVGAKDFARLFGQERIGPDALSIDPETLRARLHRSKRAIKVAMLDQRALAGIGNLYASEILHLAKIDPCCRCSGLNRAEWHRLHAATMEVLELAVRHEGSTLSDGTYRNALNQSGSYQNHHRVYARAGERCPTCQRGRIVRIVQSQRSTFYCPNCQRKPAKRARPSTIPR
jgi:formamidopyrimidine-DNA glycosylase